MKPLATALAERVVALEFRDLPEEVLHWAKVGILDTVGVTLAGCAALEASTRIVQAVVGRSTGSAVVFGSPRRMAPLDAATINGTAGHALDFDDCNNTFCGHPSVPVLPALFALVDECGATGEAFLTAYVAGVETECKLALGAGLHQYAHGWHPTSTLGVFGAAAACARLIELDTDRTATALGIATSLASGIKANFGTMTKPLHVGQCARSGLLAALLAREGFTANAAALEHAQGYLELFNGAGNVAIDAIVPAWGNPFDLARPGLAIKQYPCCGSTHPAIDALLEVVRAHPVHWQDVARIEAWIHARRLRHTDRPHPTSPLEAKFSLQYVIARALVDRALTLDHFEPEALADERIAALLPRIEVAPYSHAQFPPGNHFAGEVRLTLVDGTVYDGRVEQALGRSIDRPLPAARLAEKFMGCATRVLAASDATALRDDLLRLETLADMRAITDRLATVAGASLAPAAHESLA